MARAHLATRGHFSVASIALSLWLYLDNRSLRARARRPTGCPAHARGPVVAAARSASVRPAAAHRRADRHRRRPRPRPPCRDADRDRWTGRARRTEEFAAQSAGSTARPTTSTRRGSCAAERRPGGPALRRRGQRKVAQEKKAHVTPEQRPSSTRRSTRSTATSSTSQKGGLRRSAVALRAQRPRAGSSSPAGSADPHDPRPDRQDPRAVAVRTMYDAGFDWGSTSASRRRGKQLKAAPPPPRK